MSAAAPIEAGPATGSCVRVAGAGDVAGVAAAVAELLLELGGTPPQASAMLAAARTLIEDGDTGAVLVAQAGEGGRPAQAGAEGLPAQASDELVGVLAASWQTAIHIPGRYALIQDLWVHRSWRSNAVGAALLRALFEQARVVGIERVEVGLPRESFPELAATTAFYQRNGFTALGARMRMVLS